jgi:hypothetical protein
VLESFKGESDLHVNHLDGNKQNNYLENLEYVTCRENLSHGHLRLTGKTGYYLRSDTKKWVAHVNIDGVQCHLGQCNEEETAKRRYQMTLDFFGIDNKYA